MGLADVLARLGVIYGSPEALALTRAVAAAVYFGAMRESCRLAEAEGPYETFAGSPVSEGKLQPDLWAEAGDLPGDWELEVEAATGGFLRPSSWAELRIRAMRGVRNAYVTAYMPTATTSNIVGQNECFEPFTSNIYPRKTLAGEFLVVNRHLMRRLTGLGLWDEKMRRVPAEVRRLHRTAREIHPSLVIRMAKSMAPFICQSMSMNLFLDEPDLSKIVRFLVEGWRAGLKTGMYYCHMKPAAGSQKTSIVVTNAPAPAVAEPAPAAAPAVAEPAAAAPAAPVVPVARRWTCTDEVCTSCAL
jgi:ribonucleotide reductase alpha subunit